MPDRSLKPGLILGIVQPPAHARRMGQREENASFALVPLADSVHQGQRTKNGVDRHLAHRKNRYRVHKAKCMVEERPTQLQLSLRRAPVPTGGRRAGEAMGQRADVASSPKKVGWIACKVEPAAQEASAGTGKVNTLLVCDAAGSLSNDHDLCVGHCHGHGKGRFWEKFFPVAQAAFPDAGGEHLQ